MMLTITAKRSKMDAVDANGRLQCMPKKCPQSAIKTPTKRVPESCRIGADIQKYRAELPTNHHAKQAFSVVFAESQTKRTEGPR